MLDGLRADHQAEARQVAADHVVERPVPRMALDVLEQQRGAFFQAHQIGERGRFEVRIDFGGDALQFPHRLDLRKPCLQAAAEVAACRRPGRIPGPPLLLAAARTDRHAHIHVHPSLIRFALCAGAATIGRPASHP